jgi:hypothetical protein
MRSEASLLERIVAQQWNLGVPIVAQKWDFVSHQCKNDLNSLLEDSVTQQWPGITLVQE